MKWALFLTAGLVNFLLMSIKHHPSADMTPLVIYCFKMTSSDNMLTGLFDNESYNTSVTVIY